MKTFVPKYSKIGIISVRGHKTWEVRIGNLHLLFETLDSLATVLMGEETIDMRDGEKEESTSSSGERLRHCCQVWSDAGGCGRTSELRPGTEVLTSRRLPREK